MAHFGSPSQPEPTPPEDMSTVLTLAQAADKIKQQNVALGVDPLTFVAGTYASSQYQKELGQQTWAENVVDGFKQTAVFSIYAKIRDESFLGLFGHRRPGTPYDKELARRNMPPEFDRHVINKLLLEDTLEGFVRAKARAMAELEVGARMAMQDKGAGLSNLLGMILDIDTLIFTPLVSGAFKAVKLGRYAYRVAKSTGLSDDLAMRAATMAMTGSGGLQAGIVIGAVDLTQRETRTWQEASMLMLTMATFGVGIGGAFKVNAKLILAKKELAERIIRDDPSVHGELDIETMHSPDDVLPIDPAMAGPGRADFEDPRAPSGEGLPTVKAVSPSITKIEKAIEHSEGLVKEAKAELADGFKDLSPAMRKSSIRLAKSTVKMQEQILEAHKVQLEEALKRQSSTDVPRGEEAPYATPDRTIADDLADGAVKDAVEADTLVRSSLTKLDRAEKAVEAQKERVKRDKKNLAKEELPTGKRALKHTLNKSEDTLGDLEAELESAKIDADKAARPAEADPKAQTVGGEGGGGVGAQSVGGGASRRPLREINDPNGPVPPEVLSVIDGTDAWRWNSDFDSKKSRDAQSAWVKVMTSQIGSFGMATITQMYTSKASTLNWFGSVILETAGGLGRGRATSSSLMENYHRRIMSNITFEIDPMYAAWAKLTGNTWMGTGHHISYAGRKAFNRELMLELNERKMGRGHDLGDTNGPSREIWDAANHYDAAGATAVDVGKGRKGQISLDGAEKWEYTSGYTPYHWIGANFTRITKLGVPEQNIIEAMAEGYRVAGMAIGKDAEIVAKATMQRAKARAHGVDESMNALMTQDGRAFMRESLVMEGVDPARIDSIMERMTGSLEERSKEGFAKGRNDIDLNIPIRNELGLDLRLVDLLNQDIAAVWQRYSRSISGAGALARNGVTNRAQRKVIIEAAQTEQRALGEVDVDGNPTMAADNLRAMFSHFDGGPVWGYALGGDINKGIHPLLAVVKRITNLGLLGKLGITQAAETSAMISQMGVTTWYRRGPMALWDAEMRADNATLRKDAAFMIGNVGFDNRYYAEWLDIDDVSMKDQSNWMKTVSKMSSNASMIQSHTSLFNGVRRYQQQLALTGMIDKVMRTVREAIDDPAALDKLRRRFEDDLGLGREELDAIARMIDDGTIEFHEKYGYVITTNMERWDVDLAETWGAAMVRNMNQVVQKAMAGEQDAWLHTGVGSVMTHLSTFSMLGFQKQFMRNGRQMDLAAVTAVMYGFGITYIAANIKDAFDGRHRTQEELWRSAFGYANMTSWIGMAADPILSGVGLNDWRFNPYGPFASLMPPVVSQMDKLARVPGALFNMFTGQADYYDRQSVKALPFMNTYFVARLTNKPDPNAFADAFSPESFPIEIDGSVGDSFNLDIEGRRAAHDAERALHDATVDRVFNKLLGK